jgi:hypothetical protein
MLVTTTATVNASSATWVRPTILSQRRIARVGAPESHLFFEMTGAQQRKIVAIGTTQRSTASGELVVARDRAAMT